ncbi:MAG: hypothetical protein ACREH8_22245 [Opitutaceae bacterium]
MRREVSGDCLRPHAGDDGSRVDDLESGLLRRALERADRSARRDFEALPCSGSSSR